MPDMKGKSVASWDPGQGKGKSNNDKLMSTEARENKDCVTAVNELKPYQGGSGKPSGPLGLKGKEF